MKHVPNKGWTATKSSPFSSKWFSVNISCKKGLITKQAKYVYSKCKNENVVGNEQGYECENGDKPQVDSHLNPHECGMLTDFQLYNVHSESAEIGKWSV